MKNVYSVGQVNAYIKNMFSQDYLLRSLSVSGEVSNVKYHSSGHIYFTMKDQNAAIACVMFSSDAKSMNFRMRDGMQVIATGSVNIYERDGKYQIYVKSLQQAGAGALYEEYERRKQEYMEMGMFDDIYKQPIPKYAMRIGVVTASTGAAIQDIRNISHRRNPYVQIILYSALVQGEGAKESIVRGIETLTAEDVDVIIVGRGGGSIEDLWAFNEECVARAIFDCPIPIVSAVGHETDTTIADYVADLRAPTPSAAAELTVFSYEDFLHHRKQLQTEFRRQMKDKLSAIMLKRDNYLYRMEKYSPATRMNDVKYRQMSLSDKLTHLMEQKLDSCKAQMELYISRMKALSPLSRLEQGYAYVADSRGHKITGVSQMKPGDTVSLYMSDGCAKVKVEEV